MEQHVDVPERLALKGVTRRDFMKFCGFMATVLGLPMSFVPKIAHAVAAKRPTVLWLHFAECTGCTESFIRTTYPWAADIILDTIDLAYCETVMAAAGDQAEQILEDTVKKQKGEYPGHRRRGNTHKRQWRVWEDTRQDISGNRQECLQRRKSGYLRW